MRGSERRILLAAMAAGGGDALSDLAEVGGEHVDRALLDLVERGRPARQVCVALRVLDERGFSPWLASAAHVALASPFASVRRVAIGSAATLDPTAIERILLLDPSHAVRRAAVRRREALRFAAVAASDPHWRVRATLIERLADDPGGNIELGSDPRSRGVHAYMSGDRLEPIAVAPLPTFWDDDPAVMGATVDHRKLSITDARLLVVHEDERVRRAAGRALRRLGDVDDLAHVFRLDVRTLGLARVLDYLDEKLDEDRRRQGYARALEAARADGEERSGAIVRALGRVAAEHASPWRDSRHSLVRAAAVREAWALGLLSDPSEVVQLAAIAALSTTDAERSVDAYWPRASAPARAAWLTHHPAHWGRGIIDPDGGVRALALAERIAREPDTDVTAYLSDEDPRVRALALAARRDVARARRDDSPRVWEAVAEAAGLPIAEVAGETPSRPAPQPAGWSTISGPVPSRQAHVPLGATGLGVSRLGVSGHYGLGRAGFERALANDVNFFFWEPSYESETEVFRSLAPSLRAELVVAAGSFGARPDELLGDLERALRITRLGRIDLFLIFWVRSWARVTDEAREALLAAQQRGDIGAWGISTHRRALAREAIERGLDPVMVRHNLAHRGAEEEIFPTAVQRGTGIITFSNLLYGRLLEPVEGDAPTAPECYAYSLAQPAVSTTLTAPASEAELTMNLRALELSLDAERMRTLREHGAAVHDRERRFRRCVRER